MPKSHPNPTRGAKLGRADRRAQRAVATTSRRARRDQAARDREQRLAAHRARQAAEAAEREAAYLQAVQEMEESEREARTHRTAYAAIGLAAGVSIDALFAEMTNGDHSDFGLVVYVTEAITTAIVNRAGTAERWVPDPADDQLEELYELTCGDPIAASVVIDAHVDRHSRLVEDQRVAGRVPELVARIRAEVLETNSDDRAGAYEHWWQLHRSGYGQTGGSGADRMCVLRHIARGN